LDIAHEIDERLEGMFKDGASVWAYDGRHAGQWVYDEETQGALKAAEDAGKHTLEMMLCGHVVVIDMKAGIQENRTTLTTRGIHKVTAGTPGVKGIGGMPSTRRRAVTNSA
jgi:hypothetical protein